MGVFKNAFLLSSADEILGDFFQTTENVQDIRDALEEIRYEKQNEEKERDRWEWKQQRPDIEDNYFFNPDSTHSLPVLHYNLNNIKNIEAVVEYTKHYEALRKEAAHVGLNAAGFMPRDKYGDLVGTPTMFFVAFLRLEDRISKRKKRAEENPGLALAWEIRRIIYHVHDRERRNLMLRNLLETELPPEQIITENEVYSKVLEQLVQQGYEQERAMAWIVELTRQVPGLSSETAEDILTRILTTKAR